MARNDEPQRPSLDVTVSELGMPRETLESGPGMRRWPQAVVWGLSGLMLLVVALDTVDHSDPQAKPAVRSIPSPTRPQPVVTTRCRDACDVKATPTRAIRSVFARHLPGSIVVSEHTVSGRANGSDTVVQHRVVRAVSGNVEIKVTIAHSADGTMPLSRLPSRIAHDGYVIGFRFAGFYPPSHGQLRELADDRRLISASS